MRTAVITGASSGIGAAFARALARRGYRVILIARRAGRLASLAAELDGEAVACDLATPEGLDLAAARLAQCERLSLLVNNAGFGTKGYFHESPLERQQEMHRLHVMATVRLTHAALGRMIEQGEGAVVNVSSVAAFARSSFNVSYCATKSWMTVFTEGLHLELAELGSPVQVQALCPGFTFSEFHDVLGVDRATIPGSLWMRAEDVVEESLRALERRRWLVIPGWRYRLFCSLMSVIPTPLRLAIEARNPQRRARAR
jgi:short-subunit dehydrogenase